MRTAVTQAEERGLIKISGRSRITLRAPTPQEYYEDGEIESVSGAVERRFLSHFSSGSFSPGEIINGLGLARELRISIAELREYLNRFERYGIVLVDNSPIKLLLVIVVAAAIVIGQKIIRLRDDGTVIIGNSPVKLLLAILGHSAVVKVNRHVFRGQCVGIYLCGAGLDA